MSAAPKPSGQPPGAEIGGKKNRPSAVVAEGFGMVVDTHHPEVTQPAIEDVVDRCRLGEERAFRQLFETHKDKVYSIALRYSGDPAVAMDIAQDTFVKLITRIQQYRGEASFESWLYRLVVNSCLDHRRRHRRLQPLLDEFLDVFGAPQRTTLDDLIGEEMQAEVRSVVARLAPEQRVVVVLRYTEGLSYEEIAEVLGCSRGTVASRLNRAHKALERRLRHRRKNIT
jgi:RNA polymerase sigma-70 factor (ECF subfamily)